MSLSRYVGGDTTDVLKLSREAMLNSEGYYYGVRGARPGMEIGDGIAWKGRYSTIAL